MSWGVAQRHSICLVCTRPQHLKYVKRRHNAEAGEMAVHKAWHAQHTGYIASINYTRWEEKAEEQRFKASLKRRRTNRCKESAL